MTPFSERPDVREAIRQVHGLGDEWTVRFTAGERRVREMARQYRASGFEARVVPVVAAGGDGNPRPGPAGKLRVVVTNSPCAPCLADTWVLLTRRSGAGPPDEDLPYR